MNSSLRTFLHLFLYSSIAVLLLFCKVSSLYTHTKAILCVSLGIPLSLKVPNVIYMKDSFPDCMSCQMEDSCRKVASNISQGMKWRLHCGNQGYWLSDWTSHWKSHRVRGGENCALIIHTLLNLAPRESAYGFTGDPLWESVDIKKMVGPEPCELGLPLSESIRSGRVSLLHCQMKSHCMIPANHSKKVIWQQDHLPK